MDWIKKHTKEIGIGLGITAVIGAGLYILFGKDGDREEEEAIMSDETKGKLSKLQRANIIAGIKIDKDGNVLSLNTISQISDAVIKFASGDFIELTHKDRQERRSNKGDLSKYVDLWNDYTKNLE